jgi:hypothetical protein
VGVGAALGFVTAQFMYLWVQQASGDYSTPSDVAVLPTMMGEKPRSELERVLWEHALPKEGRPPEVMIAISDYNLIASGALVTWIDVRHIPPSPPTHMSMHFSAHGPSEANFGKLT